jgi:prephenate dehydrogenase
MMLDILLTNRGPALEALRLAQGQLAALTDALERDDADTLHALMERARDTRRAVFP